MLNENTVSRSVKAPTSLHPCSTPSITLPNPPQKILSPPTPSPRATCSEFPHFPVRWRGGGGWGGGRDSTLLKLADRSLLHLHIFPVCTQSNRLTVRA
jgi:hypothetical protein